MVEHERTLGRLFSVAPLLLAPCPLLFALGLCRAEARCLDIGIGAGMQSYPAALDPHEGVDRGPVAYPCCDLRIQLIGNLAVTARGSRIRTENTLAGLMWCRQYVELYTIGCGIDYNLGSTVHRLTFGAHVLAGFSDYTIGGRAHETARGYGASVYASTLQPVTESLSWGTRIGVRKLQIRVLPDANEALDSFHADVILFLSL